MYHWAQGLLIRNNPDKLYKTTQGVRTIAANHKQILLIRCMVLMQHVSAHAQEAIFRLTKHQRKCYK
jgi:hypothetical protein